SLFIFLFHNRTPTSTLFPYTTLFRSGALAQQQAHFRVIAAVVHEIGTGTFQLGDDGGIIAVACVDALEHDDLDARVFEFASDRRSEEHTSELQSRENIVCRLLLEKEK